MLPISQRIALSVALLTSLASAGLVGWAVAAPVPITPKSKPADPRPAPVPPPFIGTWLMHWCGGSGVTTFAADGTFECMWCGTPWTGTWKLKGIHLSVAETEQGAARGAPPFCWTVELDGTGLAGPLTGSQGRASLEPVAPMKKPDA